jgi:aminotransferase
MQKRSVYESVGQDGDTAGIARRVAEITVSAIKQMPVLAHEVGGCVSLGQGIPSFNTPRFIREAVVKELLDDTSKIGKYSMQPGLPELKEEVARDLKRTRGIDVDPVREVFISCGGMEALAAGIATVIERGDEVILPSPTYASHIEQVLFAEGVPVFAPLSEEEGWKIDIAAMRRAITKKTRAIVLCNPVNPTGTTFREAELRAIADLVLEHDLFVITDEAYDFLVYDNQPYFSLLSMPELKERIIGACSFSKRFCMTGWRVGFMYACDRIIQQVLKFHDAFAICAPTVSQYAALAALRATNGVDGAGDESVRQLRQALAHRRDLVCARLDRLSSTFAYVKPSGGYYVFPRLKQDLKSMDLSLQLLREAKVITIPGAAFGPTGEGHIRMSFGAAEEELTECFDRLDRFFGSRAG